MKLNHCLEKSIKGTGQILFSVTFSISSKVQDFLSQGIYSHKKKVKNNTQYKENFNEMY